MHARGVGKDYQSTSKSIPWSSSETNFAQHRRMRFRVNQPAWSRRAISGWFPRISYVIFAVRPSAVARNACFASFTEADPCRELPCLLMVRRSLAEAPLLLACRERSARIASWSFELLEVAALEMILFFKSAFEIRFTLPEGDDAAEPLVASAALRSIWRTSLVVLLTFISLALISAVLSVLPGRVGDTVPRAAGGRTGAKNAVAASSCSCSI